MFMEEEEKNMQEDLLLICICYVLTEHINGKITMANYKVIQRLNENK